MKKIHLFFIILLFTCQLVKADDGSQLRIVASVHPLLQYEVKDEVKGPTAEMIKSIINKANLSAEIEFMPWPRAFSITKNRPNTIVLSMVRTPEREDKFHWLVVVSELARVFISLKNNIDSNNITAAQAKNMIIAVSRDSNSYHELRAKGFSENKNLYIVSTPQEAFKLLISGKVDLVYNDPNAVDEYFLANNIKPQPLYFNKITPTDRRDSYIAININSDKELLNKLEMTVKEYQKTDHYLYLLNKKGG